MIKKAHAKLNLAINVLGRREDGYHYVDMISVPLELHDCLEIYELNSKYETFITADDISIVCDQSNLVHKALMLLRQEFNNKKAYRIQMYKMIPTQAGLAGGSADAACLLRTIAKDSNKNPVSIEKLARLSKDVGADIPFCLYERAARVRGIGESLEFYNDRLNFNVLIVKPKQGLSTKMVFDLYDKVGQSSTADIESLATLIQSRDIKEEELGKYLYNGLRETAMTLCSDIKIIMEKFNDFGFKAYEMSGSGSACFALTHDVKKLEHAQKEFEKLGYKVYKTSIYHKEK